MDFSQSKDDPHGVQRLLGILRRQQDTCSSTAPSTSPPAYPPSSSTSAYPPNPFSQPDSATEPSTSSYEPVSAAHRRRAYNTPSSKYSLASAEPFDPYSFNPFSPSHPNPALSPSPPDPAPVAPTKESPRDLASLSFAHSLSILSTLSSDQPLLSRLRMLRTQQHELEKRLAKEYRQFAATAENQYPNPRTRKEEDEKRRKTILAQWDGCVRRQQEELQRAGVPGVKASRERREVDKQKKVVGVLVEMLDEAEGDK